MRKTIIVTTIAVFAVSSGVWAFNASKFMDNWCAATASNVTCAGYVANAKVDTRGTTYFGFVTSNTANCTNLNCGSTQIILIAD